MLHFADTRDFKIALSEVIRHAGQPNPSRCALAAEIKSLAEKLAVRKSPAKAPGSRSRKKTPTPVGPQVLVDIAHKEADRLQSLKYGLEDAIDSIKKEIGDIRDGIETLEDEAKANAGEEITKADLESKWYPGSFFIGQVMKPIIGNVEYLASLLEDHAPITLEHDLAAAVLAFQNKLPDDGDWPSGKGEEHFKDVQRVLTNAVAKVPTGLSKASDLGKLRQTFEFIADAVKLMTGKVIPVPKIPKALEAEDPRQLGFGFTAYDYDRRR